VRGQVQKADRLAEQGQVLVQGCKAARLTLDRPEVLHFEFSRTFHDNVNDTEMLEALFCRADKGGLGRGVILEEECAQVQVDRLPLLPTFSIHTCGSNNLTAYRAPPPLLCLSKNDKVSTSNLI